MKYINKEAIAQAIKSGEGKEVVNIKSQIAKGNFVATSYLYIVRYNIAI